MPPAHASRTSRHERVSVVFLTRGPSVVELSLHLQSGCGVEERARPGAEIVSERAVERAAVGVRLDARAAAKIERLNKRKQQGNGNGSVEIEWPMKCA